eukprot:TRINITY_DN55173_c0_g1_i1.p1 TRINITY_DN55173_c0_g1~~TRINITY_DN55173_c0_g1_i1.p1  ORF type:complete len:512 (-),score=115.70 TRINITY_DN55173_c0_g1_i1:41-1486(-)
MQAERERDANARDLKNVRAQLSDDSQAKDKEANIAARIRQLTDELADARAALDKEKQAKLAAQRDKTTAEDAVKSLEHRIHIIEEEKLHIKTELFAHQQQAGKNTEGDVARLTQRLQQALKDLADARRYAEELNKELANSQDEVAALNGKILQLQREAGEVSAAHNRSLDEMLKSFQSQREAKDQAIEALQRELSETKNENQQDLMRASSIGQMADKLHNQLMAIMKERDALLAEKELSEKNIDEWRARYGQLLSELNTLKQNQDAIRNPSDTTVHHAVTVEKHGSRTRADLLRRVGDGYKMTQKCKKTLAAHAISVAEVQLKRAIGQHGRNILDSLDKNREQIEGILTVFEDVIQNYFTKDEKKTCGMSVEFLKKSGKPSPLDGETVTTTTTIRSAHSPTPEERNASPGRGALQPAGPVPPIVNALGSNPQVASFSKTAPAGISTPQGSTSLSMMQKLAGALPADQPLAVSQTIRRGAVE